MAKSAKQSLHNLITDPETGEVISADNGQVVADVSLSLEPEWRAFDAGEANERTRTGIPSSLARHDMGLSTVIGKTDRDASGRMLDTAMRSTMGRLRAWDFRTQAHSPTDRNLRQAFSELDRLKDKLGLSEAVIEKTAYIYRKAQERGLVRGRTISATLKVKTGRVGATFAGPQHYQCCAPSLPASRRGTGATPSGR